MCRSRGRAGGVGGWLGDRQAGMEKRNAWDYYGFHLHSGQMLQNKHGASVNSNCYSLPLPPTLVDGCWLDCAEAPAAEAVVAGASATFAQCHAGFSSYIPLRFLFLSLAGGLVLLLTGLADWLAVVGHTARWNMRREGCHVIWL